jgi:hypothetical protein
MALQLALSFGHIHLEQLASRSGIASLVASKASTSQQDPAQHLASSSFLPDAPLLPVPFASRTSEHFGHFTFVFISPRRAAFQSRAPPLA